MNWLQQLAARWPDLVINFLGVFAGAALGWWATTWQMRRQAQESQRRDHELTLAYLDRLKVELRENKYVARQIWQVMQKCAYANPDELELAKVIAEATSTTVYSDFVSTGLHRKLTRDEEKALHSAYAMSVDLKVMADQTRATAHYYLRGGAIDDANTVAENLRRYALTVCEHVEDVRLMFYRAAGEHRQALGRPRESEDPQ